MTFVPVIQAKIVKNNFREFKGETRKKLLKIVNETAYEVASLAYQLCPVDTGYLRSTIALEVYRRGELLKVVVAAHYAGYVEFGTRYMIAQPYLRPAAEAVRQRRNRRLGQIVKGLGARI